MCVIVHQPAGERLVKKDARALWKQNPDGGGIAYPYGDRIVVRKAMSFDKFWREYRAALTKHPKVDILIHMRIATHGKVCLENTHPFTVDEYTVMAHNGIIWDCTPYKWDDRSDTRVFVEEALPELPHGWQDNLYLASMVEAFVETSRLMFLTVDPDLSQTVYRLGSWEKHKGLYLSNTVGLYPKKNTRTLSTGWGGSYRPSTSGRWWVPSPDEDEKSDGFIEAPSDEDEYDQWMEELMAEYNELK